MPCHAVGRDLQCRWNGPDTYTSNCTWTASLLDTGDLHVALEADSRPRNKTARITPLRGFGFGGPHIDHSAQAMTVLIAGEGRDQLAGELPYVQWPIERSGCARWYRGQSALPYTRET